MASKASFTADNFLGGEWSPLAQGRISDPLYKRALNVCRNGMPIEEGSWVRRPGIRTAGTTLNGAAGRVIHFDFEQNAPYILEFTDSAMRMFAVSTQTGGLTNALPADFRLVTTNDNQQIVDISTANPAVVQTLTAHGWSTGDQIQILFGVVVNAGFVPLLRNRVFAITIVDTTHFSISDPISGATIDGSTLGWNSPTAGTVVAARVLKIATPYTAGSWANVRKVQAEKQAILLHGSFQPENLQVNDLPSSSFFATFTLSAVNFLDGPYLDPPTDGTFLTPTITAVSQGTLPASGNWTAVAWNGSIFAALNSGTTQAATSPDGVTWTTRLLPSTSNWSGVAWNGTVFAAIASGTTAAATSLDGITWTARTMPSAANWSAITWNGSVFCAVAKGSTAAATSPDGITWTSRTLPASKSWAGIAWNGTVFCAIHSDPEISTHTVATSPDGITWTSRSFSVPAPLHIGIAFYAIAWNGTVFCLVSGTLGIVANSPDGINWSVTSGFPLIATAIAWNGSIFCAIANGDAAATSADGVTWAQQSLPVSGNWDAIAAGGSTFAIVGLASQIALSSTFANFQLVASALSSINSGNGFQSTDVGRSIRILSEPLNWFVGTAYTTGQAVKFNGAYYSSIQNGTGKQPDVSPTFWTLSSAVYTWTWGTISTVVSTSTIKVSIVGPALLYTNPINTWRLGVYSNTTGWPTCGLYYQGRLWLAGAVANRVDASKSNDLFNMEPTAADGTVADNNAISYIFNTTDVNQIFWLASTNDGIVCGTQAGEWLIVAPTPGPITPTNIFASRGTTYGSSNIEPEYTQLTLCFVQRFNRTLLEYFPDVFSRRFTAPNLTETAKHLTVEGIREIRYQQELVPTIWARMGDGSLKGVTYERDNLFSSQPAKFLGWHRHDLGGSNLIESMAVGPNEDGTLDALSVVMNDGDGIRHVGIMRRMFDVSDTLLDAWFLDDSITPSGGVITGAAPNSILTLYGLWHLNGETVTVFVGGVDVGDFTVSSGAVAVPIDNDPAGLFTTAYLASISSTSAYGSMSCSIDQVGSSRVVVPAVVGFTYTSQGQLVRPDVQDQNRSPTGPGLAKPRRIPQFGAMLVNTQGIKFGTDFSKMHDAILMSSGGSRRLTLLELFTGVHWATVDDTWGFGSQLCWQIDRPYPAALASLAGFLEMQDR